MTIVIIFDDVFFDWNDDVRVVGCMDGDVFGDADTDGADTDGSFDG